MFFKKLTEGLDGSVKQYWIISLTQNDVSLRVLNDLGTEVDKVNRKNCEILYQVKANRVKGWVPQRVKFVIFLL